jgi:potassium-dependent mechanosensitive channel
MSCLKARLFLLRMIVAVVAALVLPAWPAFAQQPVAPAQPESPRPDSPRADSAAPDLAWLDATRLTLDRADATFKREGLSVQALFDLGQGLNPLRDELQARINGLGPSLAQADARLKQLGPAPAQGAPPESEAIAGERARLAGEIGALDPALKQARLLAARADELADQITERRRSLYAGQLFEPSPSVLSPFV